MVFNNFPSLEAGKPISLSEKNEIIDSIRVYKLDNIVISNDDDDDDVIQFVSLPFFHYRK